MPAAPSSCATRRRASSRCPQNKSSPAWRRNARRRWTTTRRGLVARTAWRIYFETCATRRAPAAGWACIWTTGQTTIRLTMPSTSNCPRRPSRFRDKIRTSHPRVNSTTKVYSRKAYVYAETGTEASPGGGIRPVFLRQTERSGQAQWPRAGVRERSQGSAGEGQDEARADRLRSEFRVRVSPGADRQIEGQCGNKGHQPDRLPFTHSGRTEDAGAASGLRHGAGAFGAIDEYAADLQAPFRCLTVLPSDGHHRTLRLPHDRVGVGRQMPVRARRAAPTDHQQVGTGGVGGSGHYQRRFAGFDRHRGVDPHLLPEAAN